ncbi:MAG: HPr family phosphocarrier protein [Lachnospiraceae bacterium]|nr:HPr family phosphocarrier protein [Lachnospiraceae bacterium]MBR3004429.1 HPr family phosphocarrier protein [Lachnospiraceae bacterium]MBR6349547.1 HPr family phosphocarrier protein [Lachnospiraceae bacterium]
MIIRESTVKLPNGLEARPVAMFVQIASEYSSEIMIEADGKKVNAKSIMGMMSLSLAPGEKVTISAQGTDEVEAATALDDFLGNKEQ